MQCLLLQVQWNSSKPAPLKTEHLVLVGSRNQRFQEPLKTGTSENCPISVVPATVGFQRLHCSRVHILT